MDGAARALEEHRLAIQVRRCALFLAGTRLEEVVDVERLSASFFFKQALLLRMCVAVFCFAGLPICDMENKTSFSQVDPPVASMAQIVEHSTAPSEFRARFRATRIRLANRGKATPQPD
jgi:hypothetical protein